jgi:transglutaminase-like putative cysteine protease
MKFAIRHETRYVFPQPVRLHAHRLMLRPRDSHDLRLLDARLTLSPPAPVLWSYDVFGNSIGTVGLDLDADTLSIVSEIELERFPRAPMAGDLSGAAAQFPPHYPSEERRDLGALLHLEDEASATAVEHWLAGTAALGASSPLEFLVRVMEAVHSGFRYEERYAEGTQTPGETLNQGSGTCRDFAMLMIEAARSAGFGARFATGYLHSANSERGGNNVGAMATHAWAEIYVPGAGWTDYDPTNAIVGGADLIKVAIARKPSQAIPVSGSYSAPHGVTGALSVNVSVHRLD